MMKRLVVLLLVLMAAGHAAPKTWTKTAVNGRVKFSYTYPVLPGVPDKVNATLKATGMPTDQEIQDAIKDMTERPGARLDDERKGTVELLDAHRVSVFYSGLGVRNPSAHPYHFFASCTLDLKTGAPIPLEALFKPGSHWQDKLKKLALADVRKTIDGEIPDGAFTDGFHYYLTPTSIHLYSIWDFYAAESVTAEVPLSALKDVLR